jgi:hypothetical protein
LGPGCRGGTGGRRKERKKRLVESATPAARSTAHAHAASILLRPPDAALLRRLVCCSPRACGRSPERRRGLGWREGGVGFGCFFQSVSAAFAWWLRSSPVLGRAGFAGRASGPSSYEPTGPGWASGPIDLTKFMKSIYIPQK